MGSKAPPLYGSGATEPRDDGTSGDRQLQDSTPIDMRVRLIAAALKVPSAMFYGAPSAVGRRQQAEGTGAIDLDQECVALAQAYRRIHDPDERRRLLDLVEAAAERA